MEPATFDEKDLSGTFGKKGDVKGCTQHTGAPEQLMLMLM